VGGLDEKVSETILWELFVQAGPVVNVHMPKDRITQNHQGYGFVEFMSEEDADYAIKIMNMIKLYGKPIRVNKVILYLNLITLIYMQINKLYNFRHQRIRKILTLVLICL
jgi:RNA recognition motif-containing protein